MLARGWDAPDFVLVTGDAYVDHPTFGTAIISRLLEHYGYHVAILSQPDWKTDRDFQRFGKPKLAFLVNAGNIDSMVAHYTVARNRRKTDAYSPGNRPGLRPDRAVTVYSQKCKTLYPDVPVIIGGLEASLRRFAHYDYWADKVHPSVLVDSGADLISYGMGEKQAIEIAKRLLDGEPVASIRTCAVPAIWCRRAITGRARRWNAPAMSRSARISAHTPFPAGSSRTSRMRCAASG